MVLLDISEALVSFNHEILLKKLQDVGLSPQSLAGSEFTYATDTRWYAYISHGQKDYQFPAASHKAVSWDLSFLEFTLTTYPPQPKPVQQNSTSAIQN